MSESMTLLNAQLGFLVRRPHYNISMSMADISIGHARRTYTYPSASLSALSTSHLTTALTQWQTRREWESHFTQSSVELLAPFRQRVSDAERMLRSMSSPSGRRLVRADHRAHRSFVKGDGVDQQGGLFRRHH